MSVLVAAAVVILSPLLVLVLLVAVVASAVGDAADTDAMYAAAGNVSYSIDGSTFVDTDANDNAWGGYSNGQIPADKLCALGSAPQHRARCDASEAFARMSADFRATFGHDVVVTDAYRSYAEQVATKRAKGYLAATPGYSNHGWGLAFDLGGGINDYGSAQYAWMKSNGHRFGFFHPTWAEPSSPDYAKSEPWHWQFVPAAAQAAAQATHGGATGGGTPDANREMGRSMASRRGWTAGEWTCLEQLWTGESGWNHRADNPSSSAYGIPQSLPGSKMAAAGDDWETNPATQITWGMGYIADRYGTPCKALAAWTSRSPHWY